MSNLVSVRIVVYGRVQGVFFRAFALRQAKELGLTGYVRNLPGGVVEAQAEGERKQLEKLVKYLKVGPPTAEVERVETEWSEYSGHYSGFVIKY